MQEFTTVSSSSYDPAALATKLNEKSASGWSVVSIVSTGGDVTAFLSREAVSPTTSVASTSASTSADSTWGLGDTGAAGATGAASALSLASVAQPDPEPVIAPVAEPAGWGVAPEPAATSAAASYTPTVAAVEPAPVEPAPAAAPTPSVPAGWYADPAGRFELRYWDGGTWTEHVSRAGQQYTDPPVA
jgi:hypothetical protein